LIFEPSLTLA